MCSHERTDESWTYEDPLEEVGVVSILMGMVMSVVLMVCRPRQRAEKRPA